ncbi:MAG: hypothetical protein IJU69_06470 [Bacteroidales bacterium]|nr:hypothetical protein [Bacteroidales bacterium]
MEGRGRRQILAFENSSWGRLRLAGAASAVSCGTGEVKSNFAARVWEYRKGLDQEMQFVCDTIYSRLIGKLGEIEVSIPQKNPGR